MLKIDFRNGCDLLNMVFHQGNFHREIDSLFLLPQRPLAKKGFNALIKEAGVDFDSKGQRRVIYSLRHTYATFRLHEGVNHFTLARNMGTSVKMLESFYGHTSNRAMA
jgi:integrase